MDVIGHSRLTNLTYFGGPVVDFTLCQEIFKNVSRVVVGKAECVELLMVALLADGHVLLEDVPGVGKTLIAKCLARSIGGIFKRVQFTPDLLPSDVTGFNIYNRKMGVFEFQPGPVVSNVLLADEINRTIPRTQSSLLESMEERQVTVDGETYSLPSPFFVIATQNPIELEGTFPLPEAQLDRFLLKIHLGYPDREEEIAILERFRDHDPLKDLEAVVQPEAFVELQRARQRIHVSIAVREYVADIVRSTRDHDALQYGASPRASIGLMRSAQAMAALKGRDYVLPDDVKQLAVAVLSHRLILREEERLRGAEINRVVDDVIDRTPVPVSGFNR
jgi:MoxR-like ATPase